MRPTAVEVSMPTDHQRGNEVAGAAALVEDFLGADSAHLDVIDKGRPVTGGNLRQLVNIRQDSS
jgi:hypothetical protein